MESEQLLRKLRSCHELTFSLAHDIPPKRTATACVCTLGTNQTRLEILSRPKAPKILKELLINSQVLGRPSCSKIPKDSKRFKGFKKKFKRFQKILKESKRI